MFGAKASPLPNLLSLSRAVISPLFFWTIKGHNIKAFIVLAVWAMLSDFLDGFLARKLNSITRAGKIIDPVADKLCVIMAALALAFYSDLPLILLIIIVARDILILLCGWAIARSARIIPVSNWIGKVTVAVLAITLIVYVFELTILYTFVFWSAILFVGISSVSYLLTGIRIIKHKSE
jgi:cardiolipin synthase